ncbi:uncharacterized protein METZ01_LOCUS247467, partial [marine metagenome]
MTKIDHGSQSLWQCNLERATNPTTEPTPDKLG